MKLFNPKWFDEYKRKHLYDAADRELSTCKCDFTRTSAILWSGFFALFGLGFGLGMIILSILQGHSWVYCILSLVVLGLPGLFFARCLVFYIVTPGPFYDFNKCEALRRPLEQRRRFTQEFEQQESEREQETIGQEEFSDHSQRAPEEMSADEKPRMYARVLGLRESDLSAERIRGAYLKACKLNHPDKNPDDAFATERFKLVQEAYDFFKAEGFI